MGNKQSYDTITLNWRRRIWHEVQQPTQLYKYENSEWIPWIQLKPKDRWLSMQITEYGIWSASNRYTIESDDGKKHDFARAKMIFKLLKYVPDDENSEEGTYHFVPLPSGPSIFGITNKHDIPNGIYIDHINGHVWEDDQALIQKDVNGNIMPDAQTFDSIISNSMNLPEWEPHQNRKKSKNILYF